MPESLRPQYLSQPFAPHRRRIYIGGTVVESLFILVPTVAVASGLLRPTMALDVVANIILTVPFVFLPAIVLWDAPGEHRTPMERGAELILVWLPFTAFSQLTYELPFLVGNVLGTWRPTEDPGWQWIWWQYAQADTRWWGTDPVMFALELVAVSSGATVLVLWLKLLRPETTDEQRVRALWWAFLHIAMIAATTCVYFVSEIRAGFVDIGQGWFYGVGFKFLFMNLAFMVFPVPTLYYIHRQIDCLTRELGPRAVAERKPVGIEAGSTVL
ncbi:emopamil-binding protein [Nocardia bovistercoris]|uniref:Emopamil-binding protein n=1 Tax=Nocardia bovistercoris TaxID=2785916 RepID=A0A931N3I5_9NOCA|nr:emopamil-binding protein [Nocardia bovistercoris]MBH0777772.1 emopamil-binding protein [Nocardia bovistercoris]